MKQTRYFIFSILVCGFANLQAVDYTTGIQPIFNASCTNWHHNFTNPSGGLNLTNGLSYANLYNITSQNYAPDKRVNPYDAANSVLWNKVSGTAGYGSQMPESGPPYLSQTDINLIETWINQGALGVECVDDDACAEGYTCDAGGCVPAADIDKQYNFPTKLILNTIYPNPFNPSATISWEQPGVENIHISIFNLKGELSEEFSFTKSQPGNHSFSWHPAGLPTGVYLIRLTGETFTVTQKAIYLK